METRTQIDIERPTGPRVSLCEPQSLGQLILHNPTTVAVVTVAKNRKVQVVFSSMALAAVTHFLATAILVAAGLLTQQQTPQSSASYAGPGDVVGSASTFWGLRAYTAAYASSLGKLANVCTAADAVCADVNSDANGNFNLSGTGSLTCNNTVALCTVKILYDQSGNTNCGGAACNISQATEAKRATLVVAGAANGCPTTSLPCLSTAGAQCYDSTGNFSLNQPFSFAVIVENTGGAGQAIFLTNINDTVEFGFNASGTNTIYISAGSNVVVAANNNVWHATQAVVNGASSSANADGTQATGNAGAAVFTNQQFGLLSYVSVGNCAAVPMTGFWFETGVWPIAFTAGNLTSMNSNQHGIGGGF